IQNSQLLKKSTSNSTQSTHSSKTRLDSTQAIMKWQLALGLLLCAALAVAMPSQEEKAMAERVLEETLSNLDESSVSEEQIPKLKKKIFRVHVRFG
ncbi:hypothetical protein BOX15_Mlig015779g1, partial [Macrostomum lignano]